ncbi:MAG: hypothetical protein J6Y01_00395 [Spirochaetales bacterium]|nr:hypothetical protein [Spirochaetales bacterium]
MKKIIGLTAVVAAVIMMLSACTPSGMPTSLVGVWKSESEHYVRKNGSYTDDTTTDTMYFEITEDDYIIPGSAVSPYGIYGYPSAEYLKQYKESIDNAGISKDDVCAKVIKATCNELHIRPAGYKSDNETFVFGYELSGNTLTLKFGNGSYTQTYTKE